MAPLIIIPYDTLKYLLLIPMTLCFADLEVLVPEETMLPLGVITMIPLSDLSLPPGYLELPWPLNP